MALFCWVSKIDNKWVIMYNLKMIEHSIAWLAKRWQLRSTDEVWMFPSEVVVCTTEMPKFLNLGYKYESCLFTTQDSEILARYQYKKDAIKGHKFFEEKYKLKREVR